MKKIVLMLTAVLCLTLACSAACAAGESTESILGNWYFSTYEDADNYPGTVFTADGADRYFTVYTDGTNLIAVDRGNSGTNVRDAVLEDGVLTVGFNRYSLEDGKLVLRYKTANITEVYTREPMDPQLPNDMSRSYANALRPEHYNGTWIITKYGMNNAFTDAESMDLAGKAVIEDGKMKITWTRNGQEKSFEITFDPELNNGRLYTVVNDSVSYIVSLRNDHTILLNVGLNQAQWVLRKENVIDESTVYPDAPDFEEAYAAIAEGIETGETGNEAAALLLKTAIAGGLDPAAIKRDGPFYLALVAKNPAMPLLVCEGTGEYENYLLSIGHGINAETKEPFVYYNWGDQFFTSLAYPDESVTEYYRNEILPLVAGESVWPVQIEIP